MKVTVFGIGYVGLVQAAVLAEVGHDVMCIGDGRFTVCSLWPLGNPTICMAI